MEPSGDPEAMSCGSCGGDNGPLGEFVVSERRAKSGCSLGKAELLRIVELLEVPE
jgi:hypothetical protein